MRKLLFENMGLKVSAVIISVFLWFSVTSRGQSEISLEVPIEFRNIPAGLGIASTSAKNVNVSIRGQERMIRNVQASDLRVYIDLSKAQKGEGMFYVNKDAIRLPRSLSVSTVNPLSVKMRLDEVSTKTVLVKASLTGLPEKGFFVKSIDLRPRSVKISGLKADVSRVNALKTENFDITGLKESIEQELNIDTSNMNITPDVGVVRVEITIEGEQQ